MHTETWLKSYTKTQMVSPSNTRHKHGQCNPESNQRAKTVLSTAKLHQSLCVNFPYEKVQIFQREVRSLSNTVADRFSGPGGEWKIVQIKEQSEKSVSRYSYGTTACSSGKSEISSKSEFLKSGKTVGYSRHASLFIHVTSTISPRTTRLSFVSKHGGRLQA